VAQQPLSEVWEAKAQEWAAWARTPGHDEFFWRLNWPAFLRLLPPPGREMLDVGCGEGRVGRELARSGYRLTGVDSSPTLAALAHDGGGYERVICANAEHLPFADAAFDAAIAFMSLMNLDDPAAVVREVARVLGPDALFCVAIVHPLNRPEGAAADYFATHRVPRPIERAGLRMSFEDVHRPLETYSAALSQAGFAIEELREPRADTAAAGSLAIAARRPYFLHLRCRL
jgi:ubiquinone/menaquinone biosynthesis C-methylase UbiE